MAMTHAGKIVAATCVAMVAAAGLATAQFRRNQPVFGYGKDVQYNGRFTFARLRYAASYGGRGRGAPWSHDYPTGERNFMKILNEVTYLNPNEEGNIIGLDDPDLFKYPIVYMAEPGFWVMSDEEAATLRAYFQKGGFAIFDDFRGYDWGNFDAQIHRALPEARFVKLDASHAIFHSFFEINDLNLPQFYDNEQEIFYGIFEDNDPKKRLLLIANYNNDISEYWEFSATGARPISESNEAYKIGVNYVIYGLTH